MIISDTTGHQVTIYFSTLPTLICPPPIYIWILATSLQCWGCCFETQCTSGKQMIKCYSSYWQPVLLRLAVQYLGFVQLNTIQ